MARRDATDAGEYDVEKHAIWIKAASDAMHAELLRQCDALMGAEAGTDDADVLARISKLVAEYEEVRWPIDKTPIQK
jgi:hypothetical protein